MTKIETGYCQKIHQFAVGSYRWLFTHHLNNVCMLHTIIVLFIMTCYLLYLFICFKLIASKWISLVFHKQDKQINKEVYIVLPQPEGWPSCHQAKWRDPPESALSPRSARESAGLPKEWAQHHQWLFVLLWPHVLLISVGHHGHFWISTDWSTLPQEVSHNFLLLPLQLI